MRSDHDDRDSPDVSPPEAQAPPERRGDARHVTVRLVAKMRAEHGEELCLVRNISPGGLTAHVYSTLTIGAPVTFEFASGFAASARILWQRDNLAGAQFDKRVDTQQALTRGGPTLESPEPRAPRVELGIKARMRLGAIYRAVTVLDISQGGAKLRSAEPIAEEQKLVLMVDGLPPLTGHARWTRGEDVGVAFYTAVPFDVLAQWIPMVQQQSPA
jgi:hypothetical protein